MFWKRTWVCKNCGTLCDLQQRAVYRSYSIRTKWGKLNFVASDEFKSWSNFRQSLKSTEKNQILWIHSSIQLVIDRLTQMRIIANGCPSKKICSLHYTSDQLKNYSFGVKFIKDEMPKGPMSANIEAALGQVCIFDIFFPKKNPLYFICFWCWCGLWFFTVRQKPRFFHIGKWWHVQQYICVVHFSRFRNVLQFKRKRFPNVHCNSTQALYLRIWDENFQITKLDFS